MGWIRADDVGHVPSPRAGRVRVGLALPFQLVLRLRVEVAGVVAFAQL